MATSETNDANLSFLFQGCLQYGSLQLSNFIAKLMREKEIRRHVHETNTYEKMVKIFIFSNKLLQLGTDSGGENLHDFIPHTTNGQ